MTDEKRAANGQWEIDVSGWLLADLEDWIDGHREGEPVRVLRRAVASSVKACPYLDDPSDADAYRTLTIEQWREVLGKVRAAVGAEFRKPDS